MLHLKRRKKVPERYQDFTEEENEGVGIIRNVDYRRNHYLTDEKILI